ncbi:hypothetical protein OG799_04715 [Micromonospora sp. NBC_00898]|uniref:hypothetical protein n=1 Tax=Micromonospora sp. NBC_00898 TaxID=2975981 RepID=UPI0038633B6E|nr:hypothetical protein OG799_04715 [Micromonospora sp. NBC_00898]
MSPGHVPGGSELEAVQRHDGISGDKDGTWKREFGLNLHPGDPVTIEIVPEHITEAWQVIFAP